MSSIYQLLRGKTDTSAHGISDQRKGDELQAFTFLGDENASSNKGNMLGERVEEDVWGTIFHATEITQKSWSFEVDELEYRYIPAQQRDYTESGYCLEFTKQQMEPLQVGELIGVRSEGDELQHLCMVRWLNEEENSISAGVMRLADSMEPALIMLHHSDRRTPLNCLLGIGKDRKPQLFLPHLPGIQAKQLFLVVDGKEVPLSLLDRVVVSPLFDAFHFHALSAIADEEMSLEQVNRQLHELTHPEGEEPASDDFSDLWGSL